MTAIRMGGRYRLPADDSNRFAPEAQDLRRDRLGRLVPRQPRDVAEAPEPFHLPPRELAGGDLDLLGRVVERHPPGQVLDQLAVAGRLGGGVGEGTMGGEELADLVDPAGG